MNEKLLELAFKVRDAALWETFCDSDIFAVRLSSGEEAYCCIMGQAGEHYGIGAYVGRTGWNTYLDFLRSESVTSRLEMSQLMCARINCINCDFTPSREVKASASKTAILQYAKAHGIRNPRDIGIPDFVRYRPYMFPGPITEAEDEVVMEEVLQAAVQLDHLLKDHNPVSLGFELCGGFVISDRPGLEIPCFIPDGDGNLKLGTTHLPGRTPEPLPFVDFNRPEMVASISILPVRSNLECRFIALDSPVTPKGEAGFYPALLLIVNGNTGMMDMTQMEKYDERTTPVVTVDHFAEKILSSGTKPSVIYVMEPVTEAMLKDFCTRTGIKLLRVSRLKHLEPAWAELSAALGFGW